MADSNTTSCSTVKVTTNPDVEALTMQNDHLKKTVAELRMEVAQLTVQLEEPAPVVKMEAPKAKKATPKKPKK